MVKGVSVRDRRRPGAGARQLYWAIAFYLIFASALLGGCGSGLGRKSACDGLVYKEYGLSRKEYLPCAGEMVATMDRMRPHLEATLAGDRAAPAKAQGLLQELWGLMKKAGGRNMLEQWQDTSLTSMNIDIWNAYNHYHTFLMIPAITRNAPAAADVRGALEGELRNGSRAHQQAKNLYEGMR